MRHQPPPPNGMARGSWRSPRASLSNVATSGSAQISHIATVALGMVGLTPSLTDFPTGKVHHSGKCRMKRPCLVNHLNWGSVRAAKSEATEYPADMRSAEMSIEK